LAEFGLSSGCPCFVLLLVRSMRTCIVCVVCVCVCVCVCVQCAECMCVVCECVYK
jgi:hypothetical protein